MAYKQKTHPTTTDVESFLQAIEPPARQSDCRELARMMEEATGSPPVMWGSNIIGFGQYHYRYDSGHEGASALVGFSPRKREISVYLAPGFAEWEDLTPGLGKHRAGKGCLYITGLAGLDREILRKMIERSVEARLRMSIPEAAQEMESPR